MSLTINRDRLLSEIDALASYSDAEAPAVTRIVFTPTDLKARAWMKARCEEAGLTVRQDAVGNTFARWNGSDPAAFQTQENTMVWWEYSEAWKRYGHYGRVDFIRSIQLS
jgi:acetylornithine deacetylase/succinyl-diaminopimelate desuccinylase-like protein